MKRPPTALLVRARVFRGLVLLWRGGPAPLLTRCKAQNRQLAETERLSAATRVHALPPELIIETTTRCNLRCPLCFRERLNFDMNRQPDIEGRILRRLIRQFFPTAECVNLTLTGEPLLTSHLDDVLEACRRYNVRLSLVTNGTQLGRPGLSARMIPVLGRLELSVDSADEATFARLRGGASLPQLVESLQPYAHAAGPFDLGFSITLSRDNLAQVSALIALAHRAGCTYVRIRKAVLFGDAAHEAEVDSGYPDAYATAVAESGRYGIRLEMEPPASGTPAPTGAAATCRYLHLTAHIDRRGCLEPCLHHAPPLLAAAHAATPNAWRSGVMQSLREDHRDGRMPSSCMTCPLR